MPVLWKKGLRGAAALMTLGAGALSAQTAVRKAALGNDAGAGDGFGGGEPASVREIGGETAVSYDSVQLGGLCCTFQTESQSYLERDRSIPSEIIPSDKFGIGNRVRALEALYAVDCARDHHPPRPHQREPPNHASNRVAACRGKGGPSLDRNPYDQASRRVGTRQAESSRHDRRYHKQLSF